MVSTAQDLRWRNWSVRDARRRLGSVLWPLGCREGPTEALRGQIRKAESWLGERRLRRPPRLMKLLKEVEHFNEKCGFTSKGEQKAAIIPPRGAVYKAELLQYACTSPATTFCSS